MGLWADPGTDRDRTRLSRPVLLNGREVGLWVDPGTDQDRTRLSRPVLLNGREVGLWVDPGTDRDRTRLSRPVLLNGREVGLWVDPGTDQDRTRLSRPVLLNGREVGAVGGPRDGLVSDPSVAAGPPEWEGGGIVDGPRHGFTAGGTRVMGLGTQLWLVQHVNRMVEVSTSEAATAIDMVEWMIRWWEHGVGKVYCG